MAASHTKYPVCRIGATIRAVSHDHPNLLRRVPLCPGHTGNLQVASAPGATFTEVGETLMGGGAVTVTATG